MPHCGNTELSLHSSKKTVPEWFWVTYVRRMSGSSSPEYWWTWHVCGYKGQRLIGVKAVDEKQANYLAELLRRDGVQKITIRNHAQDS
jgi:hypothetical protein